MSSATDWLLDEAFPAVRYRAMTELLGVPASDPEPRALYDRIWASKDVQAMLARRNPCGVWEHSQREYGVHTSLRYLTAMAEHGLGRDGRLDQAAAYAVGFLAAKESADLRHDYSGCSEALLLRALVMLGYHQDPGVLALVERLSQTQLHDGGFVCRRLLAKKPGRKACYRASVAALLLYAEASRRGVALPRTGELVEYFLKRDVFYDSGDRTRLLLDGRPGWRSIDSFFPVEPMRIGLPLTVAALCVLGAGSHPSLRRAWDHLEGKRTSQGRYVLEGTLTKQPCSFGKVGAENRWVTLYALLADRHRAG